MSGDAPRFHFISGLPRAGSTLLASILRQDPAVTAGMTSPVFSFVSALLPQLSNVNEFNIFIDDAARRRLLRGVFHNYYAAPSGAVVIDTNRHWTARLPLLVELFPQAKIVCCVRSLVEIVQSFEAAFAKSPLELSRMTGYDPGLNLYARVDQLLGPNGVIGFPLNGLKEAFFGALSDRLMVVSYAQLCARPEAVVDAVCRFLDIAPLARDFASLRFEAPDYDRAVGLRGLHTVRPVLSAVPAQAPLPPDILARLQGGYFWENPKAATQAKLEFAR